MVSAETQSTLRAFSATDALFCGLETVSNRITNEVGRAVPQWRRGCSCRDRFGRRGRRVRLLFRMQSNVAYDSREAAEELVDRNHADLHDRMLQVVRVRAIERPWHPRTSLVDGSFGKRSPNSRSVCCRHRLGENQFTDQIQHAVDPFSVDTQYVLSGPVETTGAGVDSLETCESRASLMDAASSSTFGAFAGVSDRDDFCTAGVELADGGAMEFSRAFAFAAVTFASNVIVGMLHAVRMCSADFSEASAASIAVTGSWLPSGG